MSAGDATGPPTTTFFERIIAIRDTYVAGPAKAILFALGSRADAAGRCFPSLAQLAQDAGVSVSTVQRALAALELDGHVEEQKRDGTSSVYFVHPQPRSERPAPIEANPGHGDLGTPVSVTGLRGQADRAPRSERPTKRSKKKTKKHTTGSDRAPCGTTPDLFGETATSTAAAETTSDHQALMRHYAATFERVKGVKPTGGTMARSARGAKALLRDLELEEAMRVVDVAFADTFIAGNQPFLDFIAGRADSFRGRRPVVATARHQPPQLEDPATRCWTPGEEI